MSKCIDCGRPMDRAEAISSYICGSCRQMSRRPAKADRVRTLNRNWSEMPGRKQRHLGQAAEGLDDYPAEDNE